MNMMKYLAVILACCLSFGVASGSFAAGRAMLIMTMDDEDTDFVLIKFNETQFSQIEAETLAQYLVTGASEIPSELPVELDDLDYFIFTPEQMLEYGLGDADATKLLLQALALDHLFIDLSKKNAPVPGTTNFNLDVYYYGTVIGPAADLYLLTLGIPEYLLDMALE